MKVLCCGDRNWLNYDVIVKRLSQLPKDTIIIQGEARGADLLCKKAAIELGLEHLDFPANWKQFGRAAGTIRNTAMLNERPDLVIAFHDNIERSIGTVNCLRQAEKRFIETQLIVSIEFRL